MRYYTGLCFAVVASACADLSTHYWVVFFSLTTIVIMLDKE